MAKTVYALILTCRGVAAVVATGRGIARFVWPQLSAARARALLKRLAPGAEEVAADRLVAGPASGTASGKASGPASRAVLGPGPSPSLAGMLADYFAGRAVDFAAVPLDLSAVSPFRVRVLTALRRVGYGRTISYGELARRVGRPGAARAVGAAMAANPLPVILPCHRVLRGDGGLGGYSAPGGLRVKRELLKMETVARDQ